PCKIQKLSKKQNTTKNNNKTGPLTATASPLTTPLSSATLWPLLLTPTPTSHHTQPDHTFTKHFMKLSQHTTRQHSLTLNNSTIHSKRNSSTLPHQHVKPTLTLNLTTLSSSSHFTKQLYQHFVTYLR